MFLLLSRSTKKKIIFFLVMIIISVISIFCINQYDKYKKIIKESKENAKIINLMQGNSCLDNLNLNVSFPENSVLVEPHGGLGNQMFHYAAAYSLAKKTNRKLYIITDKDAQEKDYATSFNRNFTLHNFNISFNDFIYKDVISDSFLRKTSLLTNVDESNFFHYYSTPLDKKLPLFISSHADFESEIFFEEFKNDIIKIFTPKVKLKKQTLNDIQRVSDHNSVCVHLRKNDMMQYYYYLPVDYQKQAINLAKKIINNPKFFVFSDNIYIAKSELSDIPDLNYINHSPLEDFAIMRSCGNNIIANSTFGWWASYLNKNNPDHITIAPSPRHSEIGYRFLFDNDQERYVTHSVLYSNSYPENWIQLEYNKLNLNNFINKNIKNPYKKSELLKNVQNKEFSIYSGKMDELQICDQTGEHAKNKKICTKNNLALKNDVTVVTAYYDISSKFGKNQYIDWMKNFMSIPNNLVVFTDKKHSALIKELRGDLPLLIIEKEFKELYHNKFLDKYKQMKTLDLAIGNKKHSPELYTLWAEKVKFVNEAIKIDHYKSNFFVWTDIGMFREKEFVNNNYPSTKHMISGKMSFIALGEFKHVESLSRVVDNDSVRIAGSPQVGDKLSWQIYNELWDETLKNLMDKNLPARNDQAVIASIALKYPQFVNLIYPDIRYKGYEKNNHRWWYSLLYFSDIY